MTHSFSLNIWTHPSTGAVRLYINGTTRRGVYFKLAKDGRMVWSSKTNDTPAKYGTGNHYKKIQKDSEAAHEVAEAFGLQLGEGSVGEFERAVGIAQDGIEVSG